MKKLIKALLVMVMTVGMQSVFCQEQPVESEQEDQKVYMVIKNDGTRFVGRIIKQDAREVLIETSDQGQIYIPRHEIREIREVSERELTEKGDYVPGEIFASRYFITTNALSIAKKETYMIWNLFGPDIQFGISDNLGIGIMTTWLGVPLIGTAKYSIPLADQRSVGVGLLLGTDTWGGTGFRLALPYGVATFGNNVANVNFSLGYGVIRYKEETYNYNTWKYDEEIVNEGRLLMSLAFMFKAGRNISVVFDTFISPTVSKDRKGIALIMPGLRFQTEPERAFQIGFAGIYYDGETFPVPLPMVQWFRKL